MDTLYRLLKTDPHWMGPVMRVLLGTVMLAHGSQKLLGWFGGAGFSKSIAMFDAQLGIPAAITFLVIVCEFFGGLGLLAGFLTRVCAASFGLVMVGAIVLVHAANGFFMNWFGQQAGEGYEYHLLALAACAGLALAGGGRGSLDALLAGRLKHRLDARGRSHLRAA
jgi:putative oxidoreductase